MEMAGIVTNTGSEIIKMTREIVDDIGISLELDTDGIWCMIPSSFPENFKIETEDGNSYPFSFPRILLNSKVSKNFTNHQYQKLNDNNEYEKTSECSIYFEVDGPYHCMILPAAKEEGKNIKKRLL
jgi:DNA polymerase epsilon subunit 1